MSSRVSLYERAVEGFASRVRAVGDDQWQLQTPNSDWDVRALVNHVVYENRWAVPMLAGGTVDEVGDRFDGDLLGDDPKATWDDAAGAAVAAAGEDGVLTRTVHVSFGDIPGEAYLSQLTIDHTIHAWDLARAIGADDRLDPELVEFVFAEIEPQAEMWREAGAFGPRVDVPPDADAQDRLLALTGRHP